MSDPDKSTDELAGSEQPFVQHLMELRDRLLYGIAGLGVCMALLAIWPGPSGLIDLIAVPIRAHMPPDAKLIAVSATSPSLAGTAKPMVKLPQTATFSDLFAILGALLLASAAALLHIARRMRPA